MNKIITSVGAVAMAGLIAITGTLPAQAQNFGQRDRVIQSYCDRNPRDRDCRGYYDGRWRDRDYDRFYNSRRSNLDGLATGLFGFTFGAILGGAIANSNNNSGYGDRVVGPVYSQSNVQACYNRYRSYDARTNTYLGYDGIRHQCRL